MNNEDERKTLNALTPVDGFSDTGDTAASPIRGIGFRFKEGKIGEEYIAYSEPFPVANRIFAAIDKTDGWQKLAEGVPPEYLMRKPGELRPPRPHVDEKDWPVDLNDKPVHPWKLTQYLYLLDTATGEISTFWSNTTGGKMAFAELSDQVKIMREMNRERGAAFIMVTHDDRLAQEADRILAIEDGWAHEIDKREHRMKLISSLNDS